MLGFVVLGWMYGCISVLTLSMYSLSRSRMPCLFISGTCSVCPGWLVANNSDNLFVRGAKGLHVLRGAVTCAPDADRADQVWVHESVV